MAAGHRLEIHKKLGEEQWVNTYLIEAVDMDEASDLGLLAVEFERRLHRDNVLFEYFIVSTRAIGDRVFRHVAVNAFGLKTLTTNSYLPLFNTIRIDFSTLDSDPCRKYYRVPVIEAEQTNGILEPAEVTAYNATISTYFFGTVLGDNLFTPKGHVVVSGSVSPKLQMRQLHRHKKKKLPE